MLNPHRPRRALATIPVALLNALLLGTSLACASRGVTARDPATENVAPPPRPAPDTSSVAIGDGKSIERLFAGRFPGVSVATGPNGGLQIRIRGGSTSFTGGEEPLFVIDGTPLSQGTGGIVFLNPYDIEKIEVLKNPADVGVYGVRGANGVILITTNRPGRR